MTRQLPLFREDALPDELAAATPRAGAPHAGHAPDAIASAAAALYPGVVVRVTYRRQRRQLFRFMHRPDGSVDVAANEVFRTAPEPIAAALVQVVVVRQIPVRLRRALATKIRDWFGSDAAPTTRRPRFLPPTGRHHDLTPLVLAAATRLSRPFEADVGWSVTPTRRLLGRFERGDPRPVIIINRALDAALVPAWYLEFLLYHELLHGVIPARPGRGRLLVHPPEFRRMEREHPAFQRARRFERWVTGRGFRLLLADAPPSVVPADLRIAHIV